VERAFGGTGDAGAAGSGSAGGAGGGGGAVGEAAFIPDPGRLVFFREVKDGFDREKAFLFAWLDSSVLSISDLSSALYSGPSAHLLAMEVK